jgi:serine/threonine protein kinase/predicted ATPase
MNHHDTVQINGRYLLQEKLGAGGMGTVFRALDRLTHTPVAIKLVTVPTEKLEFHSRMALENTANLRYALTQEFKTLASLRHPHIISVLDYGFNARKESFLTMELLEDARTVLEAGSDQPIAVQINLVIQVLQALTYLHRRNIIHRDIKPENVLYQAGQVKLLDFGLAVARSKSDLENANGDGEVAGTLAYMAPEVLQGMPATEAADIYAVGILLYSLLFGKYPYDLSAGPVGLIYKILREIPNFDNPNLHPHLAIILRRMLLKDPGDRYHDARTVINALAEVIERPDLMVETQEIRESFLQAAEFVGREAELQQLQNSLLQATDKKGSAWLIGGESGVGKSRLLDEMRSQSLVEGALVLEGQAINTGSGLYHIWKAVMRRLCLDTELSDFEVGVLKTLVPDIEALLNRTVPEPPQLGSQAAFERLVSVIKAVIYRTEIPLLIILEDLQWAGAESIEILKQLTDGLSNAAVLIIGSYRNEERATLPDELPHMQTMLLSRLKVASITALTVSMLGNAGNNPHLIGLLERETEGNTFFIVEVVRALAEEAGNLNQIGIMTLPQAVFSEGMKTVIQRRLQRIPADAHHLLRLAAVAGRQLDINLLKSLAAHMDMDAWLELCTDTHVLDIKDDRWIFAHDKLREGLLRELDTVEIAALHRQIGTAIETCYAEHLTPHLPRLAYHWAEVVKYDKANPVYVGKAAGYLLQGAQQAIQNFGNQEAIDYCTRGLELVTHLPDSPERIQLELGLQIFLAVPITLTQGWAAERVGKAYQRAHELCQMIGQAPQLLPALVGVFTYYLVRGNYPQALAMGKQNWHMALDSQDPEIILEVGQDVGACLFYMGDYAEAFDYLEQSYAQFDAAAHYYHSFIYGKNPGVVGLVHQSLIHAVMGRLDTALQIIETGIAITDNWIHPFSRIWAFSAKALVHQMRGEIPLMLATAQIVVEEAQAGGYPNWLAQGLVWLGWSLVAQGALEQGLPPLHQGNDIWVMSGSYLMHPYLMTLLADGLGKSGDIPAALAKLDEAFALVKPEYERWAEAEQYRLRGELLWQNGETENAEAAFNTALTIAQERNALLHQLNAAMSLARLWRSENKNQAAVALLEPIYRQFSEGLDTPCLQQAKTLLATL